MQITLFPSRLQFDTDGSEDLLSAGLRQRIGLPHGCRSGQCGACKALVKSGQVTSLGASDGVGTEAKTALLPGEVLLCKARALSDLALEIRTGEFRDVSQVMRCEAVVISSTRRTGDIIELHLQLQNTAFSYQPGQYLDILHQGQRKSFSIANAFDGSGLISLHIRMVNAEGFTGYVFNHLQAGETLAIEGPFGDCVLTPEDLPQDNPNVAGRALIFLASGTGFAPIKAMLEAYLPKLEQRPVTLYWGARQCADIYDAALLQQWEKRFPHFTCTPVISGNASSEVMDDVVSLSIARKARAGLVHHAVMEDFSSLAQHDVIACGNPAMVNASRKDFVQLRDLSALCYRADAFVAAPPLADTDDISVLLINADQSTSIIHAAKDLTLLEALKKAGVPIMHVCGGKGACGTCTILPAADDAHLFIAPSDRESGLLACLDNIPVGTRLACQITISTAMKGVRLQLLSP